MKNSFLESLKHMRIHLIYKLHFFEHIWAPKHSMFTQNTLASSPLENGSILPMNLLLHELVCLWSLHVFPNPPLNDWVTHIYICESLPILEFSKFNFVYCCIAPFFPLTFQSNRWANLKFQGMFLAHYLHWILEHHLNYHTIFHNYEGDYSIYLVISH